MWIRSQGRLRLHNVNRIEIEHFENKEIVTVTGDGWFLGEYSTEEKALKVLDEIQRKIECPDSSLISPAASINYYHLSVRGHFYQMPADDEVKI